MSDTESEEETIVLHKGKDIKKYNYEKRMAFEEVFRLNHLDAIQDLYDEIREHFESNYEYHPKMNNLQDFIDFCMENSYIIEMKDNYENHETEDDNEEAS